MGLGTNIAKKTTTSVANAAKASAGAVKAPPGKKATPIPPKSSNGQAPPVAAPAAPPTVVAPATTSTPAAVGVDEYARKTFGYLAAYLDHPEIGPILRQAGAEQWSAERMFGAISQTSWWKATSATARQFDQLANSDPASVAEQIRSRAADVVAQATELGAAGLNSAVAEDIARRSLREGWDSTQLDNAVRSAVVQDPALAQQLIAGKAGTSIRRLAADYAIPLSEDAVSKWVTNVTTGAATLDQLQAYVVDQAKSMHPTLAGALDQGMTVRQIASPYFQTAGKVLGVNPDLMQLDDPQWMAALDTIGPDGVRRPMTIDEWTRKLKSESRYGWDQTDEARAQAYSMVNRLGEMFGKVA